MKDYSDISNEDILEMIRKADQKVDGNITGNEFDRIAEVSTSFVQSRFGNWNNAKEEAGLEKNRKGLEISMEEVIQKLNDGMTIKGVAEEQGINYSQFRKNLKSKYKTRSKVSLISLKHNDTDIHQISFCVPKEYSDDLGVQKGDNKYFEVEEASEDKIVLSIHDEKVTKRDEKSSKKGE